MARASYKGTVLAESDSYAEVEGNIYFPPSTVARQQLRNSETTTVCPWKGTASYYDVVVGDEVVSDGAWYYPSPSEEAKQIKDFVAFYKDKGIEISN